MIKRLHGIFLLLLSSFVTLKAVSVEGVGDEIHPKIFGMLVGKSTLNDVQQMFGIANIEKAGDAASSTSSVCYIVVNKNNPMFDMVFSSHSELAGPPEYELTHAVLYKAGYSTNIKGCTNFEAKNDVALEQDDLANMIGKSQEKIVLSQGEPTSLGKNKITYSSCRQIPMKKRIDPHYDYWAARHGCFDGAPYYDICTEKEITFNEEGKAIIVKISYSKTVC